MWRSKSCALLRYLLSHSHFQPHPPLKTLTLTVAPSPSPLPYRLLQNPRFFSAPDAANPSSVPNPDADELDIEETAASSECSTKEVFEGTGDALDRSFDEAPDESAGNFNDGVNKGDAFGEVIEETGDAEEEVAVVDAEQVESVVAILKSGSEEAIELSLDALGLNLSEDFVVKVIEGSNGVGENLIGFYKWALGNEESVKSVRVIELLVQSVKNVPELKKMEAYMLWDLVKELGKDKWALNSAILNDLIAIFWSLGKAKAGFEVFSKFDELGCTLDAESYYYTIQALGKRSMFDTAWSVCEKMLSSGSLPSKEQIGEIITFFCKGKKAKEAHLVYLMAKEKNLTPQRSSLDFLICGLARNDETVTLALELLEDYPWGSYKHANKTFGAVIKGLCKVKKPEEAKRLLLKMVEAGPAPGNASFNFVINALAKGGELEDAVALLKVMESRGLRPDVYTYTVVMSGYAKGGLMDEAYKIFCEAKKRHAQLSPATYHVLTRGYCKMEEFDKALECMKEMKEHGVKPNADEYNKMIQSLCLKALDWRSAEQLLEEMKDSGLYLKAATRSLVAAVREIEEEETQPEVVSIAA